MRMGVKFFAPISLLSLLFLLPTNLLADETDFRATISGSLINGTTDDPVSGLKVILKRFEGDQEKELQNTLSDPEGNFYFRGLEPSEEHGYIVHTVYNGVEYSSSPVMFKDQKRDIPVEMTVYETTDSDKEISVPMHHVLLQPQEGSLWVRELMIIENKDNRVYVGSQEIAQDKKETLRISLPAQAREFQILKGLMSCCIVELQDGFADTMDIKPGKKELHFQYKIDYKTSSLALSKKINLMTGSLDFFIPNRGIRASGENVQYAGLMGKPEEQFLHFTGKMLAKGIQVALKLESMPKKSISLKGIAPILAVALFAFAMAYPFIRKRRKATHRVKMEKKEESREKMTLQEQRENLILAMAELDDQLDAGQISSEEHEEKRRVLKEKVFKLTTKTLSSSHSPL